jgi:hypothetical protein
LNILQTALKNSARKLKADVCTWRISFLEQAGISGNTLVGLETLPDGR